MFDMCDNYKVYFSRNPRPLGPSIRMNILALASRMTESIITTRSGT